MIKYIILSPAKHIPAFMKIRGSIKWHIWYNPGYLRFVMQMNTEGSFTSHLRRATLGFLAAASPWTKSQNGL